jgi:hypothetical protein
VIEPRYIVNEKDDIFDLMEVNTDISVTGKEIFASPGSESMACLIL